jgi:nitric oxide dioxygenase
VGDVLQLSVPCGDFYLNEASKRPIALISGGVGLTPNLSILEHVVAEGLNQHVTFVLGVKNAEVEPMHEYLSKIRRRNLNVKVKFIYDDPPNSDYPAGPVTIEQIKQAVPQKDSDFYLCGPPGMMNSVNAHPQIYLARPH